MSHPTPEQIAHTYDLIGHHWDDPQFDQNNGIPQHEKALAFLSKRKTAIDLGCGSNGRIIQWLLNQGFETEGLDYSQAMLKRAQARFPKLKFHHADICQHEFTSGYDFISGWDSLWHIPLPKQLPMLTKVMAALTPGGVFISTTGGVYSPDHVTNPCFSEPLYHAAPGIPALLRCIEQANCLLRHLEYDQWPEQHVYYIVQRNPD